MSLALNRPVRRRDLAAMLSGAALAWHARAAEAVRRIAILEGLPLDDPNWVKNRTAFLEALKARGWSEGTNLVVTIQTTAGDPRLWSVLADEIARERPDAILAVTSYALTSLLHATKGGPIVFTIMVADPVEAGFVASIPHPGGRVTGFTEISNTPGSAGKYLQLLRDAVPQIRSVLYLYPPDASEKLRRSLEAAAPRVGLALSEAAYRGEDDIDAAIARFAARVGGLLVASSPFAATHRAAIIAAAARHRLPAIYWNDYYALEGGLMSYSADQPDEFRGAADYVDRILKGANPGDLPVQEPTTFRLIVNLKTATALGLELPPTFLARADQVIE